MMRLLLLIKTDNEHLQSTITLFLTLSGPVNSAPSTHASTEPRGHNIIGLLQCYERVGLKSELITTVSCCTLSHGQGL